MGFDASRARAGLLAGTWAALAVSTSALLILRAEARPIPAPLPQTQRAVVQTGSGGPEVLRVERIPVPRPAVGQVLIRVVAASINPADAAQLRQPATSGEAIRRVPGLDMAGIILAVGPGVSDRKPGDAVFGMVDRSAGALNGAYAQYVLASAASIAPKPPDVSFTQAAGLGVVGVTALRALQETSIGSGQRLLITGIAGGVGSMAAQIARAQGVRVLGTASARHAGYLHSIGVDDVIDYTRENIAQRAGSVDAVLDTVGGDEAITAFHTVRGGGAFVSIARASVTEAQCAAVHVTCAGSPGPAARAPQSALLEVARLAQQRQLVVHVDRTYPLSQAAQALRYSRQGHVEGKIILEVGPVR